MSEGSTSILSPDECERLHAFRTALQVLSTASAELLIARRVVANTIAARNFQDDPIGGFFGLDSQGRLYFWRLVEDYHSFLAASPTPSFPSA